MFRLFESAIGQDFKTKSCKFYSIRHSVLVFVANGIDRPHSAGTSLRMLPSANVIQSSTVSDSGPEVFPLIHWMRMRTSINLLGGRCEIDCSWSGIELLAVRTTGRMRRRRKYSTFEPS